MPDNQQPMESSVHSTDEWKPCEPGALWALAVEARARRARDARTGLARGAAAAGGLALLVVAVTLALPSRAESQDGINCPACLSHFKDYSAHLRHEAEMDAALADRVRTHLEKCDFCHGKFEKRYPGLLVKSGGQARGACFSKSCCCGAVDVLRAPPCARSGG